MPASVIFFIQLVTDVELLAPIAAAVRRRCGDGAVRILVSRKALRRTPCVADLLEAQSLPFERVEDRALVAGRAPDLAGILAVVTATESTAGPHAAAHALARHANERGIPTFTMQHGLESVGLTWFDDEHRPATTRFASRHIFTWAGEERLHPATLPETRMRCVPVGCPKVVAPPLLDLERVGNGGAVIAVCENLHWRRFSERHALAFVADLSHAVERSPDVTFLVRPHPRGRWLTHHFAGRLPDRRNVVIADPDRPRWALYSGRELYPRVDAVITSPSTVALDAARAGVPVAVTAYDLELPAYEPLPMLSCAEDWETFVDAIGNGPATASLVASAGRFAAANSLSGDASERIVEVLEAKMLEARAALPAVGKAAAAAASARPVARLTAWLRREHPGRTATTT